MGSVGLCVPWEKKAGGVTSILPRKTAIRVAKSTVNDYIMTLLWSFTRLVLLQNHQKRGEKMATVYSYIRFSSKKQEQGDSIRRQEELRDNWLKRHPEHVLDQTLTDLGVSAYRGKNLSKTGSALGRFIELAKSPGSPIERGSILLIESLDRFSRQKALVAAHVFQEIIDAGLRVVILNPETIVDENNISNTGVVVPLIIGMQIAHESSLDKSSRIGAVWRAKRERAQRGEIISGRRPSWLGYNWPDKEKKELPKFDVIPEAAKAIKYIFERTVQGCGQRALTAELNQKFKPIGHSGKWNGSYVQKVLSDRAVLGEYQAYTFDKKGKRRAVGDPVKGYYPSIIDETLFNRAALAKQNRLRQKGPNSRFINLFTGLLYCTDGSPMHIAKSVTKRQKNAPSYLQRRLVSYGRVRGVDGSNPYSLEYSRFERLVLSALTEIDPGDLFELTKKRKRPLKVMAEELMGLQLQWDRWDKMLSQEEGEFNQDTIKRILKKQEEITGQMEQIKKRIESAKEIDQTRGKETIGRMADIVRILATTQEQENAELRRNLRMLIASLVEKIIIHPVKARKNKVDALIKIVPKVGRPRMLTCVRTRLIQSERVLASSLDGKEIFWQTADGTIFFDNIAQLGKVPHRLQYDFNPEDAKKIMESRRARNGAWSVHVDCMAFDENGDATFLFMEDLKCDMKNKTVNSQGHKLMRAGGKRSTAAE